MLQNKTEQNRDDEKDRQTGITFEIHTNDDGVRATAIMLRSMRLAISSYRSEASLRNYIGRPSSERLKGCSDILSNALSGRPHQSQQPSFTALSSREIPKVRLSFSHNTNALSSLFSNCHLKNLCVLWATILRDFTEHFTFRQKCQIRKGEKYETSSSVSPHLFRALAASRVF